MSDESGWYLTSDRLPPRFQNVVGIVENEHGVQRVHTVYLDRASMVIVDTGGPAEGWQVTRWRWFPFVAPSQVAAGGGR